MYATPDSIVAYSAVSDPKLGDPKLGELNLRLIKQGLKPELAQLAEQDD